MWVATGLAHPQWPHNVNFSLLLTAALKAGNKKIPSSIQAKSVCGLVVKSIVAMKENNYLFNSLDGPRVRFPANAM